MSRIAVVLRNGGYDLRWLNKHLTSAFRFSSHPKSVPVFKAFNNRLYGLGVSLTTVFRFRYTAIVCVSTRVSTSSTTKEKAKNKINWKPLEVNDSDWPSCETLQAPALRPIVERRKKNRWVLRIRSRFGELENNISCAGTRKSCNFVYILFREKVMISILAMFVFCTFDLTFKSKLRLSKSRGRPTSERFPNRKIDTKTGLLAF